MATSTISALTNTNTIDGNTVFPADYSGATYKVSANTLGNFITTNATVVSATGNVTGNYLLGNGTFITGLSASKIFNGTSEANIGTSGGNANISIGGTSNVAVFTTSGLTLSSGNITVGNILNGGANGVGNIGTSSTYFNTIFGKATTAQYADLAENYLGDADYASGTVLDFDGEQEVTLSTRDSSKRVAGVVSTNPAHLMNSTLDGAHVIAVALAGRVPTQVTGTIAKGDLMVSAGNGRARAESNPSTGTVIGKALENFDGGEGTIEIVISMQ